MTHKKDDHVKHWCRVTNVTDDFGFICRVDVGVVDPTPFPICQGSLQENIDLDNDIGVVGAPSSWLGGEQWRGNQVGFESRQLFLLLVLRLTCFAI